MKRKIIICTVLILITYLTTTTLHQRQINLEVEEFINRITKLSMFSDKGLSGDVVIKRRIKSTRKEIVMLVAWGEDQVYISAKGWRRKKWYRRDHLEMDVRGFDPKKSVFIIE